MTKTGFFDRTCSRGHRYGWAGTSRDDPGCPKCQASAITGEKGSEAMLSEVQTALGGVSREDALKVVLTDWLRRRVSR